VVRRTLQCRRISIEVRRDFECTRVSSSDGGIGLPIERKEFEKLKPSPKICNAFVCICGTKLLAELPPGESKKRCWNCGRWWDLHKSKKKIGYATCRENKGTWEVPFTTM